MKLLIITDNNVWGGSELMWYQLHKRRDVASAVWSLHGTEWMPADVRCVPDRRPLRDRLRPWRRRARRLPFHHECDRVLYVMCFFCDALVAQFLEHAGAFVDRGKPLTILVQAVSEDRWLEDSLRTRLDAFAPRVNWVFVSAANAENFKKQIPNAPASRVICNIPLGDFVSLPLDEESNWAFVGRCHAESKGLDLLIESCIGFPVTVDIYGDGPNREALTDYAQSVGSNVRFCGRCDQVAEMWRNHAVLVLCSRIEGTPIALLEAGLCGRPAVVTRVGGGPELVGPDGGIVTEANVPAIRAALAAMLGRKSEWLAMGARLQERCTQVVHSDPVATLKRVLEGA